MNSSSRQTGPKVEAVEEKVTTGGGVTATVGLMALIPAIFALLFHAGAAYMSYQRNQSIGWAILHFFLAVFYYPYAAFTSTSSSTSVASTDSSSSILPPAVQTAGKRFLKKLVPKKR